MNVLFLCYNTMIFFSDVLYTSDPPLYSVGHNNPSFRRNVNVSGAMGESRIGWQILAKNSVRKTWGVTYVVLIMEEVLSIKMLNLKNKSHLYHLGRGGGGGGKEGEGKATAFLLSQ